MSGYLHDLSPKQESLLAEFKIIVGDILEKKHDDYLLLQFLRARCFDLKKSEEMFRKHIQWRKYYPEDYFLNSCQPNELLRKYMWPPRVGFDKAGSPVRYIRAGQYDLRGIASSVKRSEIKEYIIWILDNDKRATKQYNAKLGRYVETRTFIFDLRDLSIRQVSHKQVLEMLGAFLKIYEANYPENLKVAYVINIPYFFAWLFNLVKTVLSEETVKKIKIYGKDGWQEDLFNLIDPEILPASIGGRRTDPDGDTDCSSLFGTPGPVPTYYYLKNQRKLSNLDDGVVVVHVSRRDKKEVDIIVPEVGSTILWEAECAEQDLLLGLHYKKDIGENECYKEQVVRTERFGAMYGPSGGSHVCDKSGKYVLELDNSFSILRGKTVLYRINVMPPVSSYIEDSSNLPS